MTIVKSVVSQLISTPLKDWHFFVISDISCLVTKKNVEKPLLSQEIKYINFVQT